MEQEAHGLVFAVAMVIFMVSVLVGMTNAVVPKPIRKVFADILRETGKAIHKLRNAAWPPTTLHWTARWAINIVIQPFLYVLAQPPIILGNMIKPGKS